LASLAIVGNQKLWWEIQILNFQMLLAEIRANAGETFFGQQPRKMAKFDLEQKFLLDVAGF